jgi:hypothetical protein
MVELHQDLPDLSSAGQYVSQDLILCPFDVHLYDIDLRVPQHPDQSLESMHWRLHRGTQPGASNHAERFELQLGRWLKLGIPVVGSHSELVKVKVLRWLL